MKTIVKILLYVWQLPQNLLGILLTLYYVGEVRTYSIDAYCDFELHLSKKMHGGISLGRYIILNPLHGSNTLMHEAGHYRQSLMLGWLYLAVIGLPSIVWATMHTYCKRISERYDYYSFYTERWADELGGVER